MGQVRNRLRLDNYNKIVERLWRYPGRSRPELARELRLDRSTVSQLADDLVEFGILEQTSGNSSGPKGGRPPSHLWISPGYGYAIGVELTAPLCRFVAVDLSGKLLAEQLVPLAQLQSDLIKHVSDDISSIRSRLDSKNSTVLSLLTVGIGVSGVVNEQQGLIDFSHALGIDQPIPFVSEIRSRLDLPVQLMNDAQAGALGEAATRQVRNLLLALIEFRSPVDVGIGMGLVVGGRLRQGRPITHLLHPNPIAGKKGKSAFLDSLAYALALVVNVTGVNEIILAGDVEEVFSELTTRIVNFTKKSSILSVRTTEKGVWTVSSGAARAAVGHLLRSRNLPIYTNSGAN